jgi:hypothetical protein
MTDIARVVTMYSGVGTRSTARGFCYNIALLINIFEAVAGQVVR